MAFEQFTSGLSNVESSLKDIIRAINTLNNTFVTFFPAPLTSSATWDPSSVSNGAQVTTTITVSGATLGSYVDASFSLDTQGLRLSGYVSAANTVTVILSNMTGSPVNLGSGILKVRVYN